MGRRPLNRKMPYAYRTLGPWKGTATPDGSRRPRSTFTASWADTLKILAREVWHLDGEEFVLEVDVEERDIRLDGQLRKGARAPRFPGVRVAFDSRHGHLVYATDVCVGWQHNVRSVALGLQALRAVDRHGIAQQAEQYRGFLAIEAAKPMTAAEATDLLASYGGPREALRKTHPDTGGDPAEFARVQEARRVLGQ